MVEPQTKVGSTLAQLLGDLRTLSEDLVQVKAARSERQEALKTLLHSVNDACAGVKSKGAERLPEPDATECPSPTKATIDQQQEKLLQEINETSKQWLNRLSKLEGSSGQPQEVQVPLKEVSPQEFSSKEAQAVSLTSPLLKGSQAQENKGCQPHQAAAKPKGKSSLQARMKGRGLQMPGLSITPGSVKDAPKTYRSDDGLRNLNQSFADIEGGTRKPTECVTVTGADENEFKPVIEHSTDIWNSGISKELENCIENLSCALFGLPFSVSIAIPSITDTPLIGISDGFLNLSGYSREEIVGQNCRLLLRGVPKEEISGEVREEARRYCRAAHLRNLTSMSHSFLLQRNARKNGELFWNYFMLTMMPGPDKRTYIIGLQLDLGPTLEIPRGQNRPGEGIVEGHRKNLMMVQKLMFGITPESPMSLTEETKDATDRFMGLSEDIRAWLTHAELRSESFQKWGTKPWVAWPSASKHALLNGGTTLLRLEAETRQLEGAMAMTIFPVTKKGNQCSFKVRIDQLCAVAPSIKKSEVCRTARLPTLGFTTVKPSDMDHLGGLPIEADTTPASVLLFGNGVAQVSEDLRQDEFGNWRSAFPAPAENSYDLTPGDTMECTWGKGFIRLAIANQVLWEVKDSAIVGVQPRKPIYGIVDCCGAVCRVTLMA